MQGRIVNGIKSVWETIKKEMMGPKISGTDFNEENIDINRKSIDPFPNLKIRSEKISPVVNNLNKNFILKVKDILFSKKIIKSRLLEEEFNLGSGSFDLSSENTNILEGGSLEISSEISEKKINGLNPEKERVKEYKEINIITKINRDKYCKRINQIPKKIKSEHLYRYSKQELIRILKRVKMKKPSMDMRNFQIDALFIDIPVGKIQNIKYYSSKREIELFFNSKATSKNYKDFVIFKNRKNNTNTKIFI